MRSPLFAFVSMIRTYARMYEHTCVYVHTHASAIKNQKLSSEIQGFGMTIKGIGRTRDIELGLYSGATDFRYSFRRMPWSRGNVYEYVSCRSHLE